MPRLYRLIIAFAILLSGLALVPQVSLFANSLNWQLYADVYQDMVTITRARYHNGELDVRASSTSEGKATLQVFKTSSNELIGMLEHHHDEEYRGTFEWAENPQEITVRSSLGGESKAIVGDTSPPSKPIELMALGSQDQILVDWTLQGSLNGHLDSYELYRTADGGDSTLVTNTTDSQYTDADLTAGTEYCYTVKAIDSDGNILGESNEDCATFGTLTLWVPNQVVPANSTNVPVTINLSNGDGLCIRTLDIKVSYDENVVQATGVVSPTIFTQGYTFETNTDVTGEVKISSITGAGQCTELFGPGSLFNIFFNVIGAEGNVSPLDFIEGLSATAIYDDGNLNTPVDLTLQNGSLTVGTSYFRGDINGDGVVNAADAAWSLDIASGLIVPTAQQLAACDINGDSACNSADTSLILCYAAFQNWNTCGTSSRESEQGTVSLTIGKSLQTGETITVPVTLQASNFAGGDFTFVYDSSSMTATAASTSLTNFELGVNTEQTGIIQIGLASNNAITVNDVILQLQFTGSSSGTVSFGSVNLHDNNGRDFETSALQQSIQLQNTGTTQHLLYLPTISR